MKEMVEDVLLPTAQVEISVSAHHISGCSWWLYPYPKAR